MTLTALLVAPAAAGAHDVVLIARVGVADAAADATVTLARSTLDEIVLQRLSFADALQTGRIAVDGSVQALQSLLATLDQFNRMFPVVGPRPPAPPPAFPR